MTDNKYQRQLDRQAVLYDFKIRIIDLMQNGFEAPEVGIYDEPVRYLKMNLEWFKIFAGWLSWMEHVAFWKDAEGEDYIGIQEILKFEEGIEIPAPIFPPEGDCASYPLSSIFIDYEPQDPFNQPDYIPPDYLMPPFLLNDALEYPEILGYQASDVFVPFGAVTIDPIDLATFNLPRLILSVVGPGQIELDFLAVAFGGIVVTKVGSMPNILDIVLDNIFDTGIQIIDLEVPTGTVSHAGNVLRKTEIDIEADPEEITNIYIVFAPKVNDSIIPIAFGGGIRGIQLCAFESEAMMGIEDIRFFANYDLDTYELQKRVAGEWIVIDGWIDGYDDLKSLWDRGVDGQARAVALRDLESYIDAGSVEAGWPGSDLKAYIDAAGGEPFDPSALEAAIAAAQADADAAATAAAAAQSTANGAVTVNTTQTTNINNLANRVNATEADISVLTGDVINLYGRMTTAESNIGALAFGGIWAWYHDFSIGQQGYILGSEGSYSAGVGFRSNSNGLEIVYNTEQIKEGNIGWLQCTVLYNSAATGASRWKVNGTNPALFDYNGVGVNSYGWYNLPPNDYSSLTIEFEGSGDFYLLSLRYLGRGANLPFD